MLERHYEQTGVMPPTLLNRPTLSPWNEVYMEGFYCLSSGRQNSQGVINPITFSEAMQYCDCIDEYDGYHRLRYWKMIHACDEAFISAMQARIASKMKTKA